MTVFFAGYLEFGFNNSYRLPCFDGGGASD